ncbi:MAG: hypothetical protein AB7O43_09285 [Hyphomicrobiaceae bacterium]
MQYPRQGAVAVAILLGLLAALYGFGFDERQDVVRLAAKDIRAAGKELAARHRASRARCQAVRASDEFDALADAVIAVEMLGTGPVQRWLEGVLVRGAVLSGLPVWDLSVGPAQIRVSTAVAAAGWAASERLASAGQGEPDRNRIALELLSSCGARAWAGRVLMMLASQLQAGPASLDRDAVLRLAAAFNGQETVPDKEAAIAHYVYRELVYQVFQEIRFRRRTGVLAKAH